MRGIIFQAATPRYFEGARASRALLGILISGHGHRFECGHCYNRNGVDYVRYTGNLNSVGGLDRLWLSSQVLACFITGCPFGLFTAVKSQGGC